jgi:hypothetical protein
MGKSPKLYSVSAMENTLWWPDVPVEVYYGPKGHS